MVYSIYETISSNQTFPVKIFVAPIESSTFHWHKEYEMIGILKGSINIRVESDSITLTKGDIFLVNYRAIHAIRCMEDEPNLCMILQMSPELFTDADSQGGSTRFYLDSTQKDEEPECGFGFFFRKLAALVDETLTEDRHSSFRVRAQVCAIIADLFDFVLYDVCYKDEVSQSQQELAADVIAFMEQYLEEEKVVEMTCKEFGFSRKSLDRHLKTAVGVTGKEILDDLRVEKAKKLLKNTDKNINYILDVCGFGSEKTFYRIFRSETGLTPSEFRQRGQIDQHNGEVQGYLDYEVSEVKTIIQRILNSGWKE